jgi:hypothetical protein
MLTLKAHFDGKTIILDEPFSLPLPTGAKLRIQVEPVEPATLQTPASPRFEPLDIQIDPELSHAIASDPRFNIEES